MIIPHAFGRDGRAGILLSTGKSQISHSISTEKKNKEY